jgi:hypothetical protein
MRFFMPEISIGIGMKKPHHSATSQKTDMNGLYLNWFCIDIGSGEITKRNAT